MIDDRQGVNLHEQLNPAQYQRPRTHLQLLASWHCYLEKVVAGGSGVPLLARTNHKLAHRYACVIIYVLESSVTHAAGRIGALGIGATHHTRTCIARAVRSTKPKGYRRCLCINMRLDMCTGMCIDMFAYPLVICHSNEDGIDGITRAAARQVEWKGVGHVDGRLELVDRLCVGVRRVPTKQSSPLSTYDLRKLQPFSNHEPVVTVRSLSSYDHKKLRSGP